MHHLVIAALSESYNVFSPGELMPSGDVAALATKVFATAFKISIQLSAPFIVFGLVFNLGLGVLARLMPQMQVYFVGVPLSIRRLPDSRGDHRHHDGHLSRLLRRCSS
jgi:flagellar biosynthetic protein FliR